MAARIRFNEQSSATLAMAFFTGGMSYHNRGNDAHYQCINNDLFMRMFDEAGAIWCIPNKLRSVGEIFSFYGSYPAFDDEFTLSTKPQNTDHMPGNLADFELYGSFLSERVKILLSSFGGSTTVYPSYAREKSTRHANFRGEVVISASPTMETRQTMLLGSLLPIRFYSGKRWWAMCNASSPLSLSPYVYEGWIPDLTSMIEQMSGKTFYQSVWFNGSYFTRRLTNVQGAFVDDDYVVTYTGYAETDEPQYYSWDARVVFNTKPPPAFRWPVSGTAYSGTYMSPVKFTYQISNMYPFTGASYVEFTSGRDYYFQPWSGFACDFPETPSLQKAGAVTLLSSMEFGRASRALKAFDDSVQDSLGDIVPASCFSAADAFESLEGSLGINVLQNLQKLPAIYDSLPQIKEAVSVMGKLLRKDLSVATLREIMDLLTSTTLQANFEWRPYGALLSEYLPRMHSVMQSLHTYERDRVIAYGSWSTKLYNELGRQEVSLTSRTKMVVDGSPLRLLSSVLGLDAYGLLPKASNLWDLVPFSFVANWFTGVGGSIRRAEFSILLSALPILYVHSYSLTSPFTTEELSSIQTLSIGSEAFSMKVYLRDITLRSPFPRDSRFGFGIPTKIPSLGLIGSLVYQLFT